MRFVVDSPEESSLQYRHEFTVDGWAYAPEGPPTHVVVAIDGSEVGRTDVFSKRADVSAALGIPVSERCGFRILCNIPPAFAERDKVDVSITVCSNGSELRTERRSIRFAPTDYRSLPFGTLLNVDATYYLRRAQVYAEGMPSAEASNEAVQLLLSHLETGESVLDVGCGIGAYAEPLMSAGIKWEGCEKRLDYCQQLEARGLPCRAVVDALPFEDDSFDSAIGIEVVEHITDPSAFVREVARVTRRAAYFSVPNFAILPMYWTYYAIPWHMLTPDHENFFTRFSLESLLREHFRAVEIVEYGRIPSLDSKEGLPLYNHLFAIAQH